MCFYEPLEFLVILEDDDFAGIAAQHYGIPESLSNLQITP
jgi:hypothetical protein